mgnify:CR=1 FL=1
MGTPVTFGIAAGMLKSGWHWLATLPYVIFFLIMGTTVDSDIGTVEDGFFEAAWLASMVLGSAHALAIRRRAFGLASSAHPAERPRMDALEQAKKDAEHRRRLRMRAAGIARDSPQMAVEMRIGRPDLPRSFDDGGLVDVNHAPASALMAIPGMSAEHAERIVALRQEVGGFTSAEEVAALAGLPPNLTPNLAEYGIFLR